MAGKGVLLSPHDIARLRCGRGQIRQFLMHLFLFPVPQLMTAGFHPQRIALPVQASPKFQRVALLAVEHPHRQGRGRTLGFAFRRHGRAASAALGLGGQIVAESPCKRGRKTGGNQHRQVCPARLRVFSHAPVHQTAEDKYVETSDFPKGIRVND